MQKGEIWWAELPKPAALPHSDNPRELGSTLGKPVAQFVPYPCIFKLVKLYE
jgi:hypothetical protein